MTSEFCHAAVERSVDETTYLTVSLKNGAPGSSSAVRVDHAGANISQVSRPSRMAELDPVIAPMVAPMPSVKPHGAVQLGSSKTPSKLTNSCTPIVPMTVSLVLVARALAQCHECVDRGAAIFDMGRRISRREPAEFPAGGRGRLARPGGRSTERSCSAP